jgi:hypothetical protein
MTNQERYAKAGELLMAASRGETLERHCYEGTKWCVRSIEDFGSYAKEITDHPHLWRIKPNLFEGWMNEFKTGGGYVYHNEKEARVCYSDQIKRTIKVREVEE